jgi:hypothetical protein
MEVKCFKSTRVVIAVKADGSRHKVFQVLFGRDGSLYVSFPYFRHRNGILTVVNVTGAPATTTTIDLAQTGKVASHLVKYSHHPSGQAHFSQTGKVRVEIKRQSVSLADQQGHLFTVIIQGLQAFKQADEVKDNGVSSSRTTLTFDISDPHPEALRLVGRWYGLEDLIAVPRPSVIGPIVPVKSPDGLYHNAFIVANPDPAAKHVLLLTCVPEKKIGPASELLMFYGGFDPPSIVSNATRPSDFLAFIYPVDDFEALSQRIGSIDFSPQNLPSPSTAG